MAVLEEGDLSACFQAAWKTVEQGIGFLKTGLNVIIIFGKGMFLSDHLAVSVTEGDWHGLEN